MDENIIITNIEFNIDEIMDVMKLRGSDNINVIDSGYHIFCTNLYDYLNSFKNVGRTVLTTSDAWEIGKNLKARLRTNGTRIFFKDGEINRYRLAYNDFLRKIGMK